MPSEDFQYSALFAAIAEWAMGFGETDLNKRPGLWYRRTQKVGNLGPIDVRLNPHPHEVEGVPPMTFKLSMDDYFPGLIGLVDPSGGILMRSREDGEDEAGLIAHFEAQTSARSAGVELDSEAPSKS
jgi:hypothetical protein